MLPHGLGSPGCSFRLDRHRAASPDAERRSLLHFGPGSTEPTTIVDDLEDGPPVTGLLVSSKRLLSVRAEQGGASLWQVVLEPEALAVMVERLPAGVRELVAERDGHLWFYGEGDLHRRDVDGAWTRWSLPEGAELAFPSERGGAWLGGSIVGVVEPPT